MRSLKQQACCDWNQNRNFQIHCLISIEIMGLQSPLAGLPGRNCIRFLFWMVGLLTLVAFTGPTKSGSPCSGKVLLCRDDPRLRALACLFFCRGVLFVACWIVHQPSESRSGFCLLFLCFLFYWMTHVTCFMCLSFVLWSWSSRYGIDQTAFFI